MVRILRRGVFALAAAALAVAAMGGTASADRAAEAYVEANAPAALAALSDPKLSVEQRKARFGELMGQFADISRIADFVLGPYARQARANPALHTQWRDTFRVYAVAVYQDQLDQYRGNTIRVLPGSQDATINGRFYSVVRSEIVSPNRPPFQVDWRLLKGSDGKFQVVDVAVRLDEQIVWLAIQQQRDFRALLGRNNGSIEGLIQEVRRQTNAMNARIATRESARRPG